MVQTAQVLQPTGAHLGSSSAASNSDPRFNTGSVVEEAKMTQGAPAKVPVGRVQQEPV